MCFFLHLLLDVSVPLEFKFQILPSKLIAQFHTLQRRCNVYHLANNQFSVTQSEESTRLAKQDQLLKFFLENCNYQHSSKVIGDFEPANQPRLQQ